MYSYTLIEERYTPGESFFQIPFKKCSSLWDWYLICYYYMNKEGVHQGEPMWPNSLRGINNSSCSCCDLGIQQTKNIKFYAAWADLELPLSWQIRSSCVLWQTLGTKMKCQIISPWSTLFAKINKAKLSSGPATPVHSFNVWTIIMQILCVKEWNLFK